jgi:tetratricopeptide (TPR) repeat protein
MKWWFSIGIVLMVVLAGCGYSPDSPALTGTPSQRGTAYRTLEGIDSLMWKEPDSALAVMMEFAASPGADSLNEFEGHYCQLLISELLYKTYKQQSNRDDLLQAVGYFDSIVAADGYKKDGRKTDARSASLRERNVFLDARAHYINGVGFYEKGDVVQACEEYLNASEMMEEHFEVKVLTGGKAVFMENTYGRLFELFSAQFMMDPAISCGEQALEYCQKELTLTQYIPILYYHLGKQYDKKGEREMARSYYGRAVEGLSDINNPVYRDVVSTKALCDFQVGFGANASLNAIRKVLPYANSEKEVLTRFMTMGVIFTIEKSFDSAIYYLEPVFENKDDESLQLRAAEYLVVDYDNLGDKAKSDECMRFLANHKKTEGETKALVSKLEAMYKNYQNKKQERQAEIEREKAMKKALGIIIPIIVVVLVVYFVQILRNKKQLKKQQEEADRMLGETEQEHEKELKQLQEEAQKELDERDRLHKEAVKKQQDEAIQQARTLLPQRVNDLYRSKVSNRMERIMAEFEAAYPLALERLAAAYPDLNEAERQIAVLNFLRFRSKEEADLTGFTENTTLKYRSNLNKKAGSDPISALIAEGKI